MYRLTFANEPIVIRSVLIGNTATIIAVKQTKKARTTNFKFVEYFNLYFSTRIEISLIVDMDGIAEVRQQPVKRNTTAQL